MGHDFEWERKAIVGDLWKRGYIKSEAIKKAMLKVKRELFVPKELIQDSYSDTPLPIPGNVTISAPHMHSIMLSASKLKSGDKVLEIGAGSGILLAYTKEVVGTKGKVFGIEITKETFEFAKENLKKSGYEKKIRLILGDGSLGLPKFAPFDKIISSASCPEIPRPWIDQLKEGGILITPIGPSHARQELLYIEKTKTGKIIKKDVGGVVFVNLKGKHGWK